MANNIAQRARELANKLKTLYDSDQNALAHAWWLLEWLTGKSRAVLIAQRSGLTDRQQDELTAIEDKLITQKMPLAYIIGTVQFLELTLKIKPPILIPRPETEWWVSWFIQELKKSTKQDFIILDLCTGSGCIGLALAHSFKNAHVYAVDSSMPACELAEQNKKLNNISNFTVIQSDLFQALPSKLQFDFIVSNPPYISYQEWEQLDPSVKQWEDSHALIAAQNGLAVITKIIEQAPAWLAYNALFAQLDLPQLVIEIGHCQAQAVKELYIKSGFKQVKIMKDLFEQDRVVTAELAS